jgi:hypothetical protein
MNFNEEHMISRSRALLPVAALAFLGVLCGCGGGGGGGSSAAVSGPTKKCVSRWNDSSNDLKGVATLLSNDLGDAAGLVERKQRGRCEVVFGAVGSSYVYNVFLYEPAERVYVEKQALEGPGRARKLPPRNAKLHEDGTLTLERP